MATWETLKPTRTANYWGHTMDDTRREALDSIDTTTLRSMTLEAISDSGPHGLTADQVAARLELDKLAIRPRVTELKQRGLIVDSGERRENVSGKRAAVFVVPAYLPPETETPPETAPQGQRRLF